MPIRYRVCPDDVIEITWEGDIDAATLRAFWTTYLSEPEVLRIGRTVSDVRRANFTFSGDELRQIIEQVVTPRLGDRRWRSAILVADDVQFGVARQYHVFAQLFSEDAIFRDPAAARQWAASVPVCGPDADNP